MDPYQELANAIVIRAAKDYRCALKKLKVNPHYEWALDMKKDCEDFFQSEWMMMLTNVDGIWLMEKLRKEVGFDDC